MPLTQIEIQPLSKRLRGKQQLNGPPRLAAHRRQQPRIGFEIGEDPRRLLCRLEQKTVFAMPDMVGVAACE
ncbi:MULTISPECIES: hypothetical protein [unclassified Mesorhizobium]|uniref:hypothetical protein n=1 Tax=unclassified Mesorhizobium TaxID=325217 RepID=UPI001FE0D43A|nr:MULTISPECIES: hypothetical protein [unclassified Mesorhizobium]